MTNERMVTMANQIATFFRSYPHAVAVEGVESHIRQFWERRMRAQLLDHIAHGGEGLDPLVIVEGHAPQVRHPVRYSASPAVASPAPPPSLGEHDDVVRAWLADGDAPPLGRP